MSSFNKKHINLLQKISKNNPQTIQEYLQQISPKIDIIMNDYSRKNNVKAVGGEISFQIDNQNNHINSYWKFYYLNKENNVIEVTNKLKLKKEVFTKEDIAEIQLKSSVYAITPPETEKTDNDVNKNTRMSSTIKIVIISGIIFSLLLYFVYKRT